MTLNKAASQTELEYLQHIVYKKDLKEKELRKAYHICSVTLMTRLVIIGRFSLFDGIMEKLSNLHL
jgi:hypothetical protein